MSETDERKSAQTTPSGRPLPVMLNCIPLRPDAPNTSRSHTTAWTIIQISARRQTTESRRALVGLCEVYWPSVYAFIRRFGCDEGFALGLLQAFLTLLIERRYLLDAERRTGRFRSFLLAAVKRFLAEEAGRAGVIIPASGSNVISIDASKAERSYTRIGDTRATAEALFERRWVLSVLERVMAELRVESVGGKNPIHCERLLPFLNRAAEPTLCDATAAELRISSGALRLAVRGLRKRYRELLRAEIVETVSSPEETEEEIRFLRSALGGPGQAGGRAGDRAVEPM